MNIQLKITLRNEDKLFVCLCGEASCCNNVRSKIKNSDISDKAYRLLSLSFSKENIAIKRNERGGYSVISNDERRLADEKSPLLSFFNEQSKRYASIYRIETVEPQSNPLRQTTL